MRLSAVHECASQALRDLIQLSKIKDKSPSQKFIAEVNLSVILLCISLFYELLNEMLSSWNSYLQNKNTHEFVIF